MFKINMKKIYLFILIAFITCSCNPYEYKFNDMLRDYIKPTKFATKSVDNNKKIEIIEIQDLQKFPMLLKYISVNYKSHAITYYCEFASDQNINIDKNILKQYGQQYNTTHILYFVGTNISGYNLNGENIEIINKKGYNFFTVFFYSKIK